MKRTSSKPRLGFFKYSCCAGCEFQTIFFQKAVVETLENFDITYCRMVTSAGTPEGPFDVALIEGTITEAWQADELKKIRQRSRLLFAIGSCAVNGGIPAIKSASTEHEVEKRVLRPFKHPLHQAPRHRGIRQRGRLHKGLPTGRKRPP